MRAGVFFLVMEWLNIRTATLRGPAYIGSNPTERATWLNVLAYCVDQENGGRIAGGATWKDRQWQQACGVTLREVRGASKLIQLQDGDVIVYGYSVEKELEVKERRVQATQAARKRWGDKLGNAPRNAPRIPSGNAPRNAEGEGEGEYTPLPPEGGSNAFADSAQIRRRSPERRLRFAQTELERVEAELSEIVRPGGCSYNVTPTGDKAERYEKLLVLRKTLLEEIDTARGSISGGTNHVT